MRQGSPLHEVMQECEGIRVLLEGTMEETESELVRRRLIVEECHEVLDRAKKFVPYKGGPSEPWL